MSGSRAWLFALALAAATCPACLRPTTAAEEAAEDATVPPSEPDPGGLDGGLFATLGWVSLPGGTFLMGDPAGKRCPVTVGAFRIMRDEVTHGVWRECRLAGVCTRGLSSYARALCYNGDAWPMECLDPRDAHELAGYVGNTARLCSEAEWEYAARSCGRENRYPWGNDSADLCSRMYMPGCASLPTPGAGDTAQGLAYMADGLAEWVADCWHESLCDGPRDGSAWVTDCEPVWDSPAQEVGVLRGFGDGMVWGREAYGFSPHRREYGLSGIGFRFCADEETR